MRSATSFARLLAERAGGSPSPSAYRRWITGEAVVPAWALGLAAAAVGVTIQELLDGTDGTETASSSWRVETTEAIGRLEAELIEVRQHVGLPWRNDDAAARDDDARRERERPAS